MKIHLILLFFFTVMCSESAVNDASTYTGVVGGSGTIVCSFSTLKSWRFFCRNECKGKDLLVKINRGSGQSGRYKIQYVKDSSGGGGSLSVTISNLTKLDAGPYQCGLGEKSDIERRNITIRVVDAAPIPDSSGFIRTLTVGKNFTRRCSKLIYGDWKFFCKGVCQKKEDILLESMNNTSQNGRYSFRYEGQPPYGRLYVTITQVNKADTGMYRCGHGRALSPVSNKSFPLLVLDASAADSQDPSNRAHPSAYSLPLVIIGPLVLVLLAVFLIIFYRWKTRRNFGLSTTGNADSVQVEACAVYENCSPNPAGEDSIYQNFDPAGRNQDKCLR